MLTFKIHADKYIQFFTEVPDTNFILFNWNYEVHYFFNIPIFIIYTKIKRQ